MEREKAIQLLENRIDEMIRGIISEKKKKKKKKARKNGTVAKKDSFKKQYKEIEKALSSGEVNATGVMSKALNVNLTNDDAKRSEAFKKLHKKKTPDGEGEYQFSRNEVTKIFNSLP